MSVIHDLKKEDRMREQMSLTTQEQLFEKKQLDQAPEDKYEILGETLDEQRISTHAEVKKEFDRFWAEQDSQKYLQENAKRFDIGRHGEHADEIRSQISETATSHANRTEKQRKNKVKGAAKSYNEAAKSMEKMHEKMDAGKTMDVVKRGETAIIAMTKADRKLIKAEGSGDENEAILIARNKLKGIDMLRRFYKKCLEDESLSEKDRKMLEDKLEKTRENWEKAHLELAGMIITDMPGLDEFAGDAIMTSDQFRALVKKSGEDIPGDIESVSLILDAYHKNMTQAAGDEDNASYMLARNAAHMLEVSDLCSQLKKKYRGNTKLELALDILAKQAAQKTAELDRKGYREGKGYKSTRSVAEGMDITDVGDEFSEYQYVTHEEFKEMAAANTYNNGENIAKLYGKYNGVVYDGGLSYGYVRTSNSSDINEYLRTGQVPSQLQKDPQWEEKAKKTIEMVTAATHENKLTKKTRVVRMLGAPYLFYNFGIDFQMGDDPQAAVETINKAAGKVIEEQSFMSTGYRMDEMFGAMPIMMTMLCDEGQRCFVTKNQGEGEIVFDKGTRYVVVGARAHGQKGKVVPGTDLSTEAHKNEHGEADEDGAKPLDNTFAFGGLELIVKVIKED